MEMAEILFPLFEQVVFAPILSARAAAMDDLMAAAKGTGVAAIAAESVSQALQRAENRRVGGVIVVAGSVYLVGEARSLLLGEGSREL
jgi:dihydrofolate synthase/folylpolyglutamate synthase